MVATVKKRGQNNIIVQKVYTDAIKTTMCFELEQFDREQVKLVDASLLYDTPAEQCGHQLPLCVLTVGTKLKPNDARAKHN